MEPAAITQTQQGYRALTLHKALLICGIISSVLYFITDIIGTMVWTEYSFTSYSVSELNAVGSPSRPVVVPLFAVYDILLIAFSIALWMYGRISLHITSLSLIIIAVAGRITQTFFPVSIRGAVRPPEEVMHLVLTALTVICILLTIASGAFAGGKKFRIYSIITIVLVVFGGVLSGTYIDEMDANLPTPGLGIIERINIYSYLIWVVVLSLMLLRKNNAKG